MQKPTEEQIRVRAHELWEQAGKPEGREDDFGIKLNGSSAAKNHRL
jgi:hypothetical protein